MSDFSNQNYAHVAIGIIQNSKQQVLVSRRKAESHLGGLLEFPGGKVEKNESPPDALKRELSEELNIDVLDISPLIQIPYNYPNRNVLLNTFLVNEYHGNIIANENQTIMWKFLHSLDEKQFPDANIGILNALKLPRLFAVTPEFNEDVNFISNFEKVISNSYIEIIQLRSHSLNDQEYAKLVEQCVKLCKKDKVKLIINRGSKAFKRLGVAGMHLTSKDLLSIQTRPLSKEYLVGASCHNLHEIEQANKLGLDYIFIGPVIEKQHDKNRKTLGLDGFSELALSSQIPSYAIGGLLAEDVEKSILNGGQGVAAIRSIWNAK